MKILNGMLFSFFVILMSCKSQKEIGGIYTNEEDMVRYELMLKNNMTFEYLKISKPANVQSKGEWTRRDKYLILRSYEADTINVPGAAVKRIYKIKIFNSDSILIKRNYLLFKDNNRNGKTIKLHKVK